jgi:hypothetical protein
MLVIALTGTVLITAGQFLMPRLQAKEESVKGKLVVQIIATVAIVAGNLPIFIGVPIIEEKVCERGGVNARCGCEVRMRGVDGREV